LSEAQGSQAEEEVRQHSNVHAIYPRIVGVTFLFVALSLVIPAVASWLYHPTVYYNPGTVPGTAYDYYIAVMNAVGWLAFLVYPVLFFVVLYLKPGLFMPERKDRSPVISFAVGGILASVLPWLLYSDNPFGQPTLLETVNSLNAMAMSLVFYALSAAFTGTAAVLLSERRRTAPNVSQATRRALPKAAPLFLVAAGVVAFGWGVSLALIPWGVPCNLGPSACPTLTLSQWWAAFWPSLACMCMGSLLILAGAIWLAAPHQAPSAAM